MLLLDTNVLSELMRVQPHARVLDWLDRQDARTLFVSAVSEAEIRTGLGFLPEGRRRRVLTQAANRVLDELFSARVLPFNAAAARDYAHIACHRRAAGRPISQFDCQIASIARSNGMAVATCDIEGFSGCGIEVIDPWEGEAGIGRA